MSSIIIIGGGIIGLLTAFELHRAGQKVTLIDRQAFGQESSWAGGGIISPLYPWRYPDAITRLARFSQQIYPDTLAPMQQRTGLDPEFEPNGMLILGDYAREQPQQWVTKHAINMRMVDAAQIHELAPELAERHQQGWWMPDIHQLRNPRLVALVKAYLQTTDITLLEHEAVTAINTLQNRVDSISTSKSTYRADQFVIAGGAWSSQLLQSRGADCGIKPIKGQMLLLQGRAGCVKRITLSEDRYIIPRKDGHVLIGSTTEDVGFNKDTSAQVREQLLDYAVRTIPALKSFTLQQHWSGLRPGSANGIPKIGQHPQLENLYINSGHYRNGLVLAPASARLLSEIMLHKALSLDQSDYAPCDGTHMI